jgi:CubicO group peptidase (beta-lactamase class C family)
MSRSQQIMTRVETRLASEFSGVVAVRLGEDAMATVARGLAHRQTSTPITPVTRFGIASGTKGFTAAAILRLAERGEFTLDARLAELLPGRFPGFAPGITVRHLLTHTSGVPDYCDEEAGCDFEALWADRPVYAMRRIDDFLPMFESEPMKFEPGARFAYSNSGFLILGLIVLQVTGRAFPDAAAELVFGPAGMASSGFFASDALPPETACGYITDDDGQARSNVFAIPVIGGPDGGAYTNAGDMVRFWDSLWTGALLGANMRALVRATDVGPTPQEGLSYSLGFWRADSWRSDSWFVLIGSDPGVSFVSGSSPDTGDCFVVLSNSDDGAWAAARTVREVLFQA